MMKIWKILFFFFIFGNCVQFSYAQEEEMQEKTRIFIVCSYARGYAGAEGTHRGSLDALFKFGYLDNKRQWDEFDKNNYVVSSKAVIRKEWMNTKVKNSKADIAAATVRITEIAKEFKPDIILLGDDNAANYIGNQFLDTDIPIVFWGVNNTPVKYGLVDSKENPGHNVTGVYQSGYYVESAQLLKKLVPSVKTFAILSDSTSSGRSHTKKIEYLANKGEMPFELVEIVITDQYKIFKSKALELKGKVDAFFLAQYSGLKDRDGDRVTSQEVSMWYLKNINIPEMTSQTQFVRRGILCGADDSAYKQGFTAVTIAYDILANGKDPATYAAQTPVRGALMVNSKRAEVLGITLTEDMGIEEYVEYYPDILNSTSQEEVYEK